MQEWTCSSLYAICLLCSCYMWILGSVYILQPDMLDAADGMGLREMKHDLGSQFYGPRIYISLWGTVMHDDPGPDTK